MDESHRPRLRLPFLCTFLGLILVLIGPVVGKASATTIVSLTFDDGRQTQYSARGSLAAHGMHATFYVNSGTVGTTTSSYKMTWGQLHDLASDGNEIAGHTLTHAHLTELSSSEAQHEICDDRTNLLNQGFSPVISFAYPYAEYDSMVASIVSQCGYSSARTVGGIRDAICSSCAFAETISPRDRWATRTPHIATNTTLATMQTYVTQAENHGGGWVQLVFHSICDGCDSLSVSLTRFNAFLDWLQPRAANGTVVQTVGEVMTGVGPAPPPPPGTECGHDRSVGHRHGLGRFLDAVNARRKHRDAQQWHHLLRAVHRFEHDDRQLPPLGQRLNIEALKRNSIRVR